MFPLTAISIFMADDNIDKVGDWPWMISIIQILGLLVGIFYGSKILIQWLGHRYKLCINSVENIFLVELPRGSKRQVTVGNAYRKVLPQWTPDGRQTLFQRLTPRGGA